MRNELPRTRTPLKLEDSIKLLVEVFREKFGRSPTQNEASLLQAQLWLESGGGASIIQHNVGNIIATAKWNFDFWRPPWFRIEEVNALSPGPTKERYVRLHDAMLRGEAPKAFRAYVTHRDGHQSYIKLIASTFPSILTAAGTGDPTTFALAVRDSRYCPDCDPNVTSKTLSKLSSSVKASGLLSELPLGEAAPLPLSLTKEEAAKVSPSLLSSSPPLPGLGSSYGPEGKREREFDLPTLRLGSRSYAVALLHYLFTFEGDRFDFSESTEEAVRTFQRSHRLKADGVVGPLTWKALLE